MASKGALHLFPARALIRSVTKREGPRQEACEEYYPKARQEEISPQAWFDKWWAANLATDPVGTKQNPPVLRAPNGVLKDVVELLGKGKPIYRSGRNPGPDAAHPC